MLKRNTRTIHANSHTHCKVYSQLIPTVAERSRKFEQLALKYDVGKYKPNIKKIKKTKSNSSDASFFNE